MIYLIGQTSASPTGQWEHGTFDQFKAWVKGQWAYQLDIETDVTPFYSTKKLITIQFGDMAGKVQWVIQKSKLTPQQWKELQDVLSDPKPLKLAHNAAFECIVLRFYDIVLENVYDTMLAEKVLTGGLFDDETTYSLADLAYRYLYLELDKTEQTQFGDDVLTESKILYAATDVQPLASIYRMQVPMLGHYDLDWVAALEMEVLLSYAEMTYHGLELDLSMWRQNIALADPLIDAAAKKLDAWLLHPTFHAKAIELGYISDTDRINIRWTVPKQRELLLQLLFPNLSGASIGVVRKYIKQNGDDPLLPVLVAYEAKDYTMFEQVLVNLHRDTLIEHGLLIPAGTPTINWNSDTQLLPLFQVVAPKLKNMSKESLAKVPHGIVEDRKEYKDNLKLKSSYGEAFIEKHVEPDGRVRTNFNQVVSTGRVSSYKPNMQNIPAKESVGNRYRNCFIPPVGWKFVDSDFSSQELVIIAYLSKDPVWDEALRKGQDLHSVAAEVVYGKKWRESAEDDCEYHRVLADGSLNKQKCKCKKHKVMRQACKTINFGLAYGMSSFKLSATLNITLKEADQLIEDYFKAFPKIKKLLDYLGAFGVRNGYSRTMAPFFRKRWYPFWESVKAYIEYHLADIEYNPGLGAIERAAKNAPIQGH